MNESKSSAGGVRKLVLTLVLLLVLGGFAYDQFVAKSAFSSARTKLDDIMTLETGDDGSMRKKGDVNGDGFITPEEVSKYVDKIAGDKQDVGNRYYETYSWARPIPGRAFQIFAVYNKGEERDTLYRIMTEVPDEENMPAAVTIGEDPGPPNLGGGTPPTNQGGGDDDKKGDDGDQNEDGDEGSGDGSSDGEQD